MEEIYTFKPFQNGRNAWVWVHFFSISWFCVGGGRFLEFFNNLQVPGIWKKSEHKIQQFYYKRIYIERGMLIGSFCSHTLDTAKCNKRRTRTDPNIIIWSDLVTFWDLIDQNIILDITMLNIWLDIQVWYLNFLNNLPNIAIYIPFLTSARVWSKTKESPNTGSLFATSALLSYPNPWHHTYIAFKDFEC